MQQPWRPQAKNGFWDLLPEKSPKVSVPARQITHGRKATAVSPGLLVTGAAYGQLGESISWHLKTFSDMTKSVDETLKKISVLMERQLEKQ